MAIKVTSEDGLLYFLQKLRQLFVPRELRTGSSSEYKVLSDNNLTDGLVAKIENADSHVFSGSYSDLTAKPSINGRTLEGSQSLADLGIAAAADVPTRVSQLANDSGFAVATTVAVPFKGEFFAVRRSRLHMKADGIFIRTAGTE